MKKYAAVILGALIYLSFASGAHAVSFWTIERLSDTEARISMDGSLTFGAPNNIEFVGALATTGAIGAEVPSGDFLIGGAPIRLTFGRDGTFDLSLNIDGDAAPGSTATGSLLVTLDPEIWSAIGTTGAVLNNPVANNGQTIGTFEIVAAVPLPATLPLAIAGFGVLGFFGFGVKRPA